MAEQSNRELALLILRSGDIAETEISAIAYAILTLADAVRELRDVPGECHPCQCKECMKP